MTKSSPKRVAKRTAAKAAKKAAAKPNGGTPKLADGQTEIKLTEQEAQRIQFPKNKIEQIQQAIARNRIQQKRLQAAEDDMFRQLLRAEGEFNDACRAVSEAHGVDPDHPTESWNLNLATMVMTKNPVQNPNA